MYTRNDPNSSFESDFDDVSFGARIRTVLKVEEYVSHSEQAKRLAEERRLREEDRQGLVLINGYWQRVGGLDTLVAEKRQDHPEIVERIRTMKTAPGLLMYRVDQEQEPSIDTHERMAFTTVDRLSLKQVSAANVEGVQAEYSFDRLHPVNRLQLAEHHHLIVPEEVLKPKYGVFLYGTLTENELDSSFWRN